MCRIATSVGIVAALLVCAFGAHADVVIEMVTVGDPGNAPDAGGYGAVDHTFEIGKYEVTNSQYAEFLNAVAASGDPHGLYSTDMGGGWNDIGGISRGVSTRDRSTWVYAARPNRGNRPVNYVSWVCALRFANWMHNGQGSGDTEDGAYDVSLGHDAVRKPGARFFLPSEDEWYKAAYYKGGGTDAGYWDYPTQSDTAPIPELPPGTDMANGSANYLSDGDYVDTTYYTTEVGAYSAKPSSGAYGTFDQGGNLFEWNDTLVGVVNPYHGLRGGSFINDDTRLWAGSRSSGAAFYRSYHVGFRIAQLRPLGDLNCDDLINNGDIEPFVLAVTLPAYYAAVFPDCDITLADTNGDGLTNNGDIDAFVALLGG